jgi:D-serine deaminase-like pyridoxal phosphate-dependent protein
VVRLGVSHPCSLFDRHDRFDAIVNEALFARWSTHFSRTPDLVAQ